VVGELDVCSDPIFFSQWDQVSLYIDDYTCNEMNYHGDPNLPLPPGRAWGLDGK